MKFGIREVAECKFYKYVNGNPDMSNPAFEIDTAKTSTLESASTTVYAQGGQGNSRLAAWEGEKTLTFTVEDALLSTKSLAALTGNNFTGKRLSITTDSYAGYYRIEAKTFVRDVEDGSDKLATLTIPKAKLQSNINIPMAPSGDPAAFTFTFDAFPVNKELCIIEIDGAENDSDSNNVTTVYLNGKAYTTDATNPELYYSDNYNALFLFGAGDSASISSADGSITTELSSGDLITNGVSYIQVGTATVGHISCSLLRGSTSTWYII